MGVHAVLGRLVVVRHHHEGSISTRLLGMDRIFNGFRRVVGTRAGNDRNLACRNFNANLDDALMLGRRKRR